MEMIERGMVLCAICSLSLCLAACGSSAGVADRTASLEGGGPSGTFETEAERSGSAEPADEEKLPPVREAGESGSPPFPVLRTESEVESEELEFQPAENPALANPIRAVDSCEEFESVGLRLRLPENEAWYRDSSCSIIGEKVAQIQFYDMLTESDALARAGREEDGDPSGIYYVFDDTKRESWSAAGLDGSWIEITVQVTEANSDVHGVLATWSCHGIRYTLWEDSAREHVDSVAKMAVAIAEQSSGY